MMEYCEVSGVKLGPARAGSFLSRLLGDLRRDGALSTKAGAKYIGLHHVTVYALLEIIEEQQMALIQCRDAAPEFAKRHASKALARAEVIAGEIRP
jgi:hypothetical protein